MSASAHKSVVRADIVTDLFLRFFGVVFMNQDVLRLDVEIARSNDQRRFGPTNFSALAEDALKRRKT